MLAARFRRLARRFVKDRRGGVATEFAMIVTPALLLTVAGFEFIMLMFDYQMAADATREGVRAALTHAPVGRMSDVDTTTSVVCVNLSCSPGPVENAASFTAIYDAVKASMDGSTIDVTADNVEVTYSWSEIDDPAGSILTPLVTVRLVNLNHEMFLLPAWIGISTSFSMDGFSATRLAHSQVP